MINNILRGFIYFVVLVLVQVLILNGYSAIFPSGIIVGKVVNFEKQHDDNFYSLEVELATDFQALNNVRIIKNYRQAEQKNTEREAKKND